MRPNSKLIQATFTGALGGLIFGFDIAVVAGIIDSVVRAFALGSRGQGFTVAIGPIGTVVGCFVGGVIGQRLGARDGLRYAAVLYFVVAWAAALSVSWPMLLAARLLSGIGLGSASVLGPVYIAELSPAKWRGRLVGAFQINVVSGILLGYTSDYLVRLAHLGAIEWRVMVAVASAPALLLFVFLFRIPHSPRWLASRHQTREALAVLIEMGAADPQAELSEIQSALQAENAAAHEPILQWKYRYPLFLAITIGAFNQLSGINAIFYYIHDIFAAAGFSQLSGDLEAVVIGAANLLFTLVGMAVIDHFGRKSLLLVGAVGTSACLAGVAWIFHTHSHQSALLGLLVTFVAFFSVSQGAVIWVYISEIFPTPVRSKGQGVGSASHWTTNTIISFVFPILALKLGQGTPFAFFAAATLLQLMVVALIYPETKGHTLEDLQQRLLPAE